MQCKLVALAGALALIFVGLEVRAADACGVKLIVKNPNPRHAVARSARPSDVLLVGSPPHRLTRELTAKGHKVEVVPNSAAAKRSSYAVVVADEKHEGEARAKFGDDIVVVRSTDVSSNVKSVENHVARRPVRTADRAVVAAQVERKPIAAGPQKQDRRIVAAKAEQPTETRAKEPTTQPAEEPANVAEKTTPTPLPTKAAAEPPLATAQKTEPKPAAKAEPKAEPHPTPVKVAAQQKPATEPGVAATPTKAPATLREEIYFSSGKAEVSRKTALERAVRWMQANADKHVVIEGHADPTGTPERNMDLSRRRAEAVRDHLVEAGIDGSRIEVAPHGDTRLKYGRTDSRNRRVAIEPKP